MQKQNRTKDIYIRGRKDPNMGSYGYNHLIFNTTTFWKKDLPHLQQMVLRKQDVHMQKN